MNVRTRNLSALAVAGAALAALWASSLPDEARADAIDDEVKAFEEYVKTKPDSQGLRNKIAEISLRKDPRVAEALKDLLRHADDEVKIAVAQNIGKQGDPKVVRYLMAMADRKDMDENPKLMAALLEGIGDADAKRNYKYLLKTANKYMDSSGDISGAAFRALANYVTAETVDDLIKAVGTADYVTTADNAVKKASRGAVKGVLMDLLKKVTNEQINDVKIWKEWWSDNKKTWKAPIAGTDEKKNINDSDEYEDTAYGFILKKPNRAWIFRLSQGDHFQIILEALDEGQRAAWIELTVFGTKNYKSKTPEAMAEELRPIFEGKFREIKEGSYWDRKTRIAGETGIEQKVFGPHKDFDVVEMRNVLMTHKEVMYQFVTYWKSGKNPSFKEDIEEAFKTFKLTR